MECIEMHCSGLATPHNYGSAECDWTLINGEVAPKNDDE